MPGCVRNLSVYSEPEKKFHLRCQCSECWDSSSVGHYLKLYREKHLEMFAPFTSFINYTLKLQYIFTLYLSSMMRVFLSSTVLQVFPLSSGLPLPLLSVFFFFPAFSADEQSEPEQHCPVQWQTVPSSSLG